MSKEYSFVTKEEYELQSGILQKYLNKLKEIRQGIRGESRTQTKEADFCSVIDLELSSLCHSLERQFSAKRRLIGTKTTHLLILSSEFSDRQELEEFYRKHEEELVVVDEYGDALEWEEFLTELES